MLSHQQGSHRMLPPISTPQLLGQLVRHSTGCMGSTHSSAGAAELFSMAIL